jgi:hypothetical protein
MNTHEINTCWCRPGNPDPTKGALRSGSCRLPRRGSMRRVHEERSPPIFLLMVRSDRASDLRTCGTRQPTHNNTLPRNYRCLKASVFHTDIIVQLMTVLGPAYQMKLAILLGNIFRT